MNPTVVMNAGPPSRPTSISTGWKYTGRRSPATTHKAHVVGLREINSEEVSDFAREDALVGATIHDRFVGNRRRERITQVPQNDFDDRTIDVRRALLSVSGTR